MRDWNRFFTEKEMQELWDESLMPESRDGLCGVLNAKIREAIEAAPKVHGNSEYDYGWTRIKDNADDVSARLVDVKPIEKGE